MKLGEEDTDTLLRTFLEELQLIERQEIKGEMLWKCLNEQFKVNDDKGKFQSNEVP